MPKNQAIALRKKKKELAAKEEDLEEQRRRQEAEFERREQAVKDKEAAAADDAEKAAMLVANATDVVAKLGALKGEMDEKQRKRLEYEKARGRRIRDTANRLGTEWNDKQDDGTGPKGPGDE